jgi:hypothetical protein
MYEWETGSCLFTGATVAETFSVFDHFSGSPFLAATGLASAPRKPGHWGSAPHATPRLSAIALETKCIAHR